MDAGESTVVIGEHGTLGPVRIEIHQPLAPLLPSKRPAIPQTELLLECILSRLDQILDVNKLIHNHLTRPRWWQRLFAWVKQHVALSR